MYTTSHWSLFAYASVQSALFFAILYIAESHCMNNLSEKIVPKMSKYIVKDFGFKYYEAVNKIVMLVVGFA